MPKNYGIAMVSSPNNSSMETLLVPNLKIEPSAPFTIN